MPSEPRSGKKTKVSKDDVKALAGVMWERMVLDEQTIRAVLRAARGGTVEGISNLSGLMTKFPTIYVAEAVTILCASLDVPAFPPEQPLPSSLMSTRETMLCSLIGLSRIPENAPLDQTSSWSRILERQWSAIWNWARYFYHEATATAAPSWLSPRMRALWPYVLQIVPDMIAKVACGDGFKRLTIKDNELLNLLVKVWLKLDDKSYFVPSVVTHRDRCYTLLDKALHVLREHDPSGARITEARDMILREAQGDVNIVAKNILGQFRNPAKACKECFQLVAFTLNIIIHLVDDGPEDDIKKTFMNSFLISDLVPLTVHLLSFVSEHHANTRDQQVLREDISCGVLGICLQLLQKSVRSRGGPHWAALLFKHGFLRTLACLPPFFLHFSNAHHDILTDMFRIISAYFGHRFVVASAVKAVKEITVSGDLAKLEASMGRESWATFTNLLLERTVLKTVYERDFAVTDIRKCENCKKTKQATQLFKCGGCHFMHYCSTECQKMSWKKSGHRRQCKEMQEMLLGLGTGVPTDKFLNFVALAEIRRHMPGLSQRLASDKNPSGVPLREAFFTVNYALKKVLILVRSGEDLPDVEDWENRPRVQFREVQESYPNRNTGLPAAFEVFTCQGGGAGYASFIFPIMTNTHLVPPTDSEEFAGDAVLPAYLTRKPAVGVGGNNLAFVLDEVDRFVMDARRDFRPPAPGDEYDEKSPKTIYDYVEAKVAADPNAITFVKWR